VNRIEDYALIGDCHSLALVGKDGDIDWACFPRFDSAALFCRMLDEDRGGHFSVAPAPAAGPARVTRAYVEDTNVLVTTFAVTSGTIDVTDFMPVRPGPPDAPTSVHSDHAIVRRVRCTQGEVDVAVTVAPRFEYATFVPRFRTLSPTTGEIVGGADALWVEATRPIANTRDSFTGDWSLRSGEEAWIATMWYPSPESHRQQGPIGAGDFASSLDRTIAFWREWMSRCAYRGEHDAVVRRAALVLKALTYSPSGAVIAAGTTSLPEFLGGSRNWDYRFTWIRDATMTLASLFILGFSDEASAFKRWLERSGSGRPEDLQIMYGICGERRLPEVTLGHLSGHRGSRPVRIGNAAAEQTQLDRFGQILQSAYLYTRAGGELTEENWQYLRGLTDLAATAWRKPDHGIWEMRDEPRHFVHSKAFCWLALDRAIRLAEDGRAADVETWRVERDALHDYLMEEAAPEGWFTQAVGVGVVDASALTLPAIGLLPTSDPRVLRTIEMVRRDLEQDGLVFRYTGPDGLAGGEGAFLLCSFWLLDCLIHSGQIEEAEALLTRLIGLANDVGLYGEEVDPSTNAVLGNFPQAFTHMALVTSCSYLEAAKRGVLPAGGAHDYAELALERLLASRGAALSPIE
jgi:GH15 family glucan-1,4-alpha-glucosidase